MAGPTNPIGSSFVPRASVAPASPAKAQAVRAAQRAFFEAAMGQATTTAAARPAPAAATVAAPARSASMASFDPQQPPTRILRPGSLVDIKV